MRKAKHLLNIEKEVQKKWKENSVYYVDADSQKSDLDPASRDKYFCTFPYPYMNGRLHIGHTFTLTKAEFTARFQRLLGKNVLFPLGFHCTGMPIAASADKLAKELENDKYEAEAETEIDAITRPQENVKESQKFHGKKSKAEAKVGDYVTQKDILVSSGVPQDLVENFTDPMYWLSYFPPLAQKDLEALGIAVDWRRSFITTDRNKYYDAFVRWQFNTLKKRGYLTYGTRPTIYSCLYNQPCADHDRSEGENVLPITYLVLKQKVSNIPDTWCLQDKNVYLLCSTLMMETIYDQFGACFNPTNSFGLYPAFSSRLQIDHVQSDVLVKEMDLTEIQKLDTLYICSETCALNLSYQGILPQYNKKPYKIRDVDIQDLLQLEFEHLYGFKTINKLFSSKRASNSGSGFEVMAPSIIPLHYLLLENYDMSSKTAVDYTTSPFFSKVSGVNDLISADKCKKHDVRSINCTDRLDAATKEASKTLVSSAIVEAYPDKNLIDARPLISTEVTSADNGFLLYEPESVVMGRGREICIVALCTQWFISYGNEAWKDEVRRHINNSELFDTYSPQCLNQLRHVIDWLKEWACSRTFGLGSYMPWDKKLLIESLSDSTIYFAYYTIAHFMHKDLYGDEVGILNLLPQDFTDEVFDYIFLQSDEYNDPISHIPLNKLNTMRDEFKYWYPMDLRVSGKDLIFNHLTMALFNHTAIWPKSEKETWPRSYYCNGHVMVDCQKMSKSLGNFLTLENVLEKFPADAVRIACADARDTFGDANYESNIADTAVLRLYSIYEYIENVVTEKVVVREGPKNLLDELFDNEMILLVSEAHSGYKNMLFREALKNCFYQFDSLKDKYVSLCGTDKIHKDSIYTWARTLVVILSPIAPHICEYIWSEILKQPGFVVSQNWPVFTNAYDFVKHEQLSYLLYVIDDFRSARSTVKYENVAANIYTAETYSPTEKCVLEYLQTLPVKNKELSPADYDWISPFKNAYLNKFNKQIFKEMMSFANHQIKVQFPLKGKSAFSLEKPFDEIMFLEKFENVLKTTLNIAHITVRSKEAGKLPKDTTGRYTKASFLKPVITFYKYEP